MLTVIPRESGESSPSRLLRSITGVTKYWITKYLDRLVKPGDDTE